MSAVFDDPPYFGGVVNVNIKANKNTALDLVTQINPAPGPLPDFPATPTFTNVTSSSVTFSFPGNTTGAPVSYYSVALSVNRNDLNGFGANEYLCYLTTPNEYSTLNNVTGLTAQTIYYFQSIATNNNGVSYGTIDSFETSSL